MFDFGFWELILVMIVGLIVIGPKRLPKVAAQVGAWVGKMKRLVRQFHRTIDQELQAEQLKDTLKEQGNRIQELTDLVKNNDPVATAIERELKKPAEDPTPDDDAPKQPSRD